MTKHVTLYVDMQSCNDAFQDNPLTEVTRILNSIIEDLRHRGSSIEYQRPLSDINGNTVGSAGLVIYDDVL